jgi:asparagine synthase (glutamine-hydrolysing)
MCGFVGYWDRDGKPASGDILNRMIDRINYRGPDDRGTWVKGAVGLGHARLSIIDLSPRGHQPFLTADGKGAIVYNGEVYNFKELRANLEAEGIKFHSGTDTEVVLYALHQWGPEKAIPLFNGMFGFAYFDLRDNTLWIARDRTGIKPAYFSQKENLVVFASEMKAILAHPQVPTKPDVHVLGHFLTYQRFEGEWTPFESIQQVQAGSWCKITKEKIEHTVYFDPLRDLDVNLLLENAKKDPATLTQEFEEAIAASVKLHLISDAPLATMCSGGIDSSLTTAFAKDFKPDVVAYVANVVGPVSEGAKAQLVGKHIGAKVRQIDVDRVELLKYWPTAIWHGDQPNCHANDMPYMMVTRACHADGIKVVLTGEGSDELFGGYSWQAKTYQMWKLRRLHTQFIKDNALFRFLGKVHPKFAPLPMKQLLKHPFLHLEEMSNMQDWMRHSLVTDGARRAARHEAIFEKLAPVEPLEDRAFLARALEDWYGNLQAVLHRNDRISMAASIESRPPFLENHLIHMGLHFPLRGKYYKGSQKWVVKAVGEKKLPWEIVHAQKLHFPVAMDTFTRAMPMMKGGLVAELFKWDRAQTDHILRDIAKTPQIAYNILCVEIWARLYMCQETPEVIGEELLSYNRQFAGKETVRAKA